MKWTPFLVLVAAISGVLWLAISQITHMPLNASQTLALVALVMVVAYGARWALSKRKKERQS